VTAFSEEFVHVAVAVNDHVNDHVNVNVNDREMSDFRKGPDRS
jgi:hypothetical protein